MNSSLLLPETLEELYYNACMQEQINVRYYCHGQPELRRLLYFLQRVWLKRRPTPLEGAQKIMSKSYKIRHWLVYSVGVWFWFVQIVSCPVSSLVE